MTDPLAETVTTLTNEPHTADVRVFGNVVVLAVAGVSLTTVGYLFLPLLDGDDRPRGV